MSDGDWLVTWVVFAWIAKPIIRLVQFIRLQRSRAADPDDAADWRVLFQLAAWAAFAVLMLFLLLTAVSNLQTHSNDVGAVIPTAILGIAGLVGLIAASRRVVRELKALPNVGGASIRLAHYLEAPSSVKKSMRRIYRVARNLRREEACQRGLIDEKELQRLVYSAGQQAVLSSELEVSIRDLRTSSEPSDVAAVRQAEDRIKEIKLHLKDIEESLNRTSTSASQLSNSITRPEREQQRERARAQARALDEERHRQARARLAQVNLSAKAADPDQAVHFEEQVSGLKAGYQEAEQATERVLQGPTLPPPDAQAAPSDVPMKQADEPNGVREHAYAIAKLTARGTARLSRSAAKKGAEKLRQRFAQDPTVTAEQREMMPDPGIDNGPKTAR